MKFSRVWFLLGFLVLSLTPCFAHHMAVVVNKDSNVEALSSAHLARIFQLEDKKWRDGKDVVIVLHHDSAGEKITLQRLTRMSGSQLESFIAAHRESVTAVDSDADVIKAVETLPGAVGLIDVRSITDHVKVVKVDGKLPMENGYLPH